MRKSEFVFEGNVQPRPGIALSVQAKDVEVKFRELVTKGIVYTHPPMHPFWGDRTELHDTAGYCLRP